MRAFLKFTAMTMLLTSASRGETTPLAERLAQLDTTASPRLEGEWRVFLPAGFEQPVKLVAVDADTYRLEPGSLTFSGRYEFRDGRLASADAPDAPRGFFAWQLRSSHLLTLTQQRADVGSDYTGAVLFRPAKNQ